MLCCKRVGDEAGIGSGYSMDLKGEETTLIKSGRK